MLLVPRPLLVLGRVVGEDCGVERGELQSVLGRETGAGAGFVNVLRGVSTCTDLLGVTGREG
ncbi:MAG: hypothetical protein EXS14_02605, partial [Planctomycetes bacterium]|nr:hypothetical protein [Planctomycetota bacterium]